MHIVLGSVLARRIGQLGLVLGMIGGLVLALGARRFLRGDQGETGRQTERARYLWGALLMGGAFFLLLVSQVAASH